MRISIPRARVLLLEDGSLLDVIAVELVIDGAAQIAWVREDDHLARWIPLKEIPKRRGSSGEE